MAKNIKEATISQFNGLVYTTPNPVAVYANPNGNEFNDAPPTPPAKQRYQKYNKEITDEATGESFNLYDFIGVYAIFLNGELQYIGRSSNGEKTQSVGKTLFRHFTPYNFSGENAPFVALYLGGKNLTYQVFLFENDSANADDIAQLEADLIGQLNPPDNTRLTPEISAAQYSKEREKAGYKNEKPDTATLMQQIGKLEFAAEMGDEDAQEFLNNLNPKKFKKENLEEVEKAKKAAEVEFTEIVENELSTPREQENLIRKEAEALLESVISGTHTDEVPF